MNYAKTLKLAVFSAVLLLATSARALNYGAWSAPVTVQSGHTVISLDAATDSLGRVHAVWSTTSTVYYSRKDQSGGWTTPEVLVGGTNNVKIRANNAGGLVAMLGSSFIRLDHNGNHLASPGTRGSCSGVDLTDGGTVYAMCSSSSEFSDLYYWTGSAWQVLYYYNGAFPSYPGYYGYLDLAVGPDGRVYIPQIYTRGGGTPRHYFAVYIYNPATTSWTGEALDPVPNGFLTNFNWTQIGFDARNQWVAYFFIDYACTFGCSEAIFYGLYQRKPAGGYDQLAIPGNDYYSNIFSRLNTGYGLVTVDTNLQPGTDFRIFETTTPTVIPSTVFNSLPFRTSTVVPGGIYMLAASGSSLVAYFLPAQATGSTDTDGDGLPDIFENSYGCLMANTIDNLADPDGDLLTNQQEYQQFTNPCNPNTDGDEFDDLLDCNPFDPTNWLSCATCQDADHDLWTVNCDLYPVHGAPDCNDVNPNAWNTCATCVDADTDGWYQSCNSYTGINGPDCNDTDINTWNTCAACLDSDGDSWWAGCNQYMTINGPDCSDSNPHTWNTCATCLDSDSDTWYVDCNDYTGIAGPDCNDANSFAWDTCATCVDTDLDSWFTLCNQYSIHNTLQTIGTGTVGTLAYPFRTDNPKVRSQIIYLASEIGAAGTINSIALDVTLIPGQVMNNFTIRMKPTALSVYATNSWEGPSSGWTTVYQANESISATGWRTFTFSTPFVYNGTQNIMVDFSFNNSSSSTAGNVRYTSHTGQSPSLNGYTTSISSDPLTWVGTSGPTPIASIKYPNLRFYIDRSIKGPDCDDTIATGVSCHNTCTPFYLDQDSDLYGDPASSPPTRCAPPAGYVASNTDCAPTVATVHPGATEVCNGIDDNCVGGADEGLTFIEYFTDMDGDHYGAGSMGSYCSVPADSALVAGDCNDGDVWVNPGATEVCNGIDDNCVGGIDEGCPLSSWDIDGDGIPDDYEIAHASGPMPMDYLNPADGLLDSDTDGNSNVNEYWNGTDYRVKDPKGGEGCYFWGDATGDGFIGALDITILTSRIKGPADYSRVIPNTGETQDLDDNGFWGATDTTLLTAFAKSDSTEGIATRPSSIEKLSAATASVQVGNTTHVTVALRNAHGTNTPGFGVVFSIDPSSTGTATILGGDGKNRDGKRYDMTGAVALQARSNVVILVKTAGTIKINASIPQCGVLVDRGRYCAALTMAEPFIITGN